MIDKIQLLANWEYFAVQDCSKQDGFEHVYYQFGFHDSYHFHLSDFVKTDNYGRFLMSVYLGKNQIKVISAFTFEEIESAIAETLLHHTPISEVRAFAIKCHGDQMYGDEPYSYHLDDVYSIAKSFDLPFHVLKACYLHDVLEDCEDIWASDIEDMFGYRTAELVARVTDAPGKNRRERKLKVYEVLKRDEDALQVKLCDRFSNVKNSIANNPELLKMYKKEHPEFVEHLYNDSLTDKTKSIFKSLNSLINV